MRVLSGLVLLGLLLPQARAWGTDGHSIIADLAQGMLTPAARRGALQLLGADGNLSDVASWADHMVHSWKWSAPLHFVNVHETACQHDARGYHNCTFVYARDCTSFDGTAGFCVAAAIANYSEQLRRGVAAADTSEGTKDALKFLVHFVGDIHQPLHCGLKGDRGGVLINVVYDVVGEHPHHPYSLHNIWDFGLIVNKEGREGHWQPLAREIATQIGSPWHAESARWRALTDPRVWVQESLDAAVLFAYRFANGTEIRRTHGYDDKVQLGSHLDPYMKTGGVIELQLAKAAVRLATLLNGVFSNASGGVEDFDAAAERRIVV